MTTIALFDCPVTRVKTIDTSRPTLFSIFMLHLVCIFKENVKIYMTKRGANFVIKILYFFQLTYQHFFLFILGEKYEVCDLFIFS